MLTKGDLSQIKTVVQETIQPEIKALKKNMATKKDMISLEARLKGDMKGLETRLKNDMKNMATKDDLKNMATKDDLKNLQVKLLEKIEESEMEIIATVDKHKEDKESVKVLKERVQRLENNAGLPPYSSQ